MHTLKPLALIILDGWGYRSEKKDNAIAHAIKPNWDRLLAEYPNTLISGSGKCVGLPEDQMGNSEVGHINIGAGRVVYQDLTRIDEAILTETFFSNEVLLDAFNRAKKNDKAVHIIGLCSPGGIHSHVRHINALIQFAASENVTKLFLHAFLDGRDTPPKSAKQSLEAIMQQMQEVNCGKIVSLIGRFYAMDRDKRWDRIKTAYDLLTQGIADYESFDPLTALEFAYSNNETDEFIKPCSIHPIDEPPIVIEENDTVIFVNFRSDRARELTSAFVKNEFNDFNREVFPKTHFVTFTEYDETLKLPIAFPPQNLSYTFPEIISQLGLKQLRIAETEKYAHVTFFFNGGKEKPYLGEERILIPSPKVTTYDLQPEMSAREVTEKLIHAIRSNSYDVIICNFANPDMVGHTGNFDATVKAIEVMDECVGKIVVALQEVGGEAIITADHGNAEKMFDEDTQQPHTAHTKELVPFIYVGRKAIIVKQNGILSDIAPTMLYLMGLPKPQEMTGQSILELR